MLLGQQLDGCLWLSRAEDKGLFGDVADILLGWMCACSCGAMSHKTKDCMERPRAKGAKWTNKHIAADEKVEDIQLETYEARRDRWNGYDAAEYARVMERCAVAAIFISQAVSSLHCQL